MPFQWVSVSSVCVRHLWIILPKLWKLARNYQAQVKASVLHVAQLYEWCCSPARRAHTVPAVWQGEWEGRSMRGSLREPGAHFKSIFSFHSSAFMCCSYCFGYFTSLIWSTLTNKYSSQHLFFNNFFRQWAESLILCQGQMAQITQLRSCVSTQGFM